MMMTMGDLSILTWDALTGMEILTTGFMHAMITIICAAGIAQDVRKTKVLMAPIAAIVAYIGFTPSLIFLLISATLYLSEIMSVSVVTKPFKAMDGFFDQMIKNAQEYQKYLAREKTKWIEKMKEAARIVGEKIMSKMGKGNKDNRIIKGLLTAGKITDETKENSKIAEESAKK